MVLGIPPPFPSSNFQLSVSIEKISEPISQLPPGSRNNETLGKYCLKIFFFFRMEKSEGSLSLSLSIIHSSYRFLIPLSFFPLRLLYILFSFTKVKDCSLFVCTATVNRVCFPRRMGTTVIYMGETDSRRGEELVKVERKRRRRGGGRQEKKKKERRGSLSKGNSNVRHAARSVSLRIYASI